MTSLRLTAGRLSRVAALAILVGTATVSAAPTGGAPMGASLYSGPATDPAFTEIAPRLLTALRPDQRLNATAVADSTAALERVAADPSSAALVDLATMLAFTSAKNLPADRLEFHGPLAQHCLLGFARRAGWVRSFSDLTTATGTPKPEIGLAGPDAPGLFAILSRFEPGLAGITVQRGEAGDLATNVTRGNSDLLLLVAYPELQRALVERLADNDQLALLPVITRMLSRAADDRDSGLAMQGARTDSGLTPWSRPKLLTLCSPVGVVLHGDAPAGLRDAVGRAVPSVAATLQPTLTDRAGAVANGTMNDVLDAVQGLITRVRPNN